jgi:hypothetical protein
VEQFDEPEFGIEVWGEDVIAAYDECFPEAEEDDDEEGEHGTYRPSMDCFEKSAWADWLERLADRVLSRWDRDFEMFHIFGPSYRYHAMPTAFARQGAKDRLYALTSHIGEPPDESAVVAAAIVASTAASCG